MILGALAASILVHALLKPNQVPQTEAEYDDAEEFLGI